MKKRLDIISRLFVFLVFAIILASCQTNRLGARIFRDNPELYYSKSKIEKQPQIKKSFDLSVVDIRNDFPKDFLGNKNETEDFFRGSLENSIKTKIVRDRILSLQESSADKIKIEVKSFYMGMYGFFFVSGRAVIDISVNTTIDGKTEAFDIREVYETDGSDKEYEGSMVDTIENAANITLGMTLRRVLDKLYGKIPA